MTRSEAHKRIEKTLRDIEKVLRKIDAELSAEERAICKQMGMAPEDLLERMRRLGFAERRSSNASKKVKF